MEEQWDLVGLEKTLEAEFQLVAPVADWIKAESTLDIPDIKQRIIQLAADTYQAKVELAGEQVMRQFERSLVLQMLDTHWREHLAAMDHLRQGIHLRGYAQKNPKQEYKREAFELFADMLERIKRSVVNVLMTVQIRGQEDVDAVEPHQLGEYEMQHAEPGSSLGAEDDEETRCRRTCWPSKACALAATTLVPAAAVKIQAVPWPSGLSLTTV
jgi:preprotein translocase subunit SecA